MSCICDRQHPSCRMDRDTPRAASDQSDFPSMTSDADTESDVVRCPRQASLGAKFSI